MSRIALIDPVGLVADELREALGRKPELWSEIRLFTTEEREVGTLTDVGDAAAMVSEIRMDELRGFDVVCFCGPWERSRGLVEKLPENAVSVVLSPDAPPDAGRPVVAGIDLAPAREGRRLLSPPPGALFLATVLHALPAPSWAVATLLEPVSTLEKEGLDELFEQTRALLSFQPSPREKIPFQRAFNVRAVQRSTELGDHVRAVLGDAAPSLSLQVLEPGIFHGLALSLTLRYEEPVDPEDLRRQLLARAGIESAEDPETLGPIDAAGSEEILVGSVVADSSDERVVTIWAVMDHLTAGTSANVVRIVEALSLAVH